MPEAKAVTKIVQGLDSLFEEVYRGNITRCAAAQRVPEIGQTTFYRKYAVWLKKRQQQVV
jgi:hypothetical protein